MRGGDVGRGRIRRGVSMSRRCSEVAVYEADRRGNPGQGRVEKVVGRLERACVGTHHLEEGPRRRKAHAGDGGSGQELLQECQLKAGAGQGHFGRSGVDFRGANRECQYDVQGKDVCEPGRDGQVAGARKKNKAVGCGARGRAVQQQTVQWNLKKVGWCQRTGLSGLLMLGFSGLLQRVVNHPLTSTTLLSGVARGRSRLGF